MAKRKNHNYVLVFTDQGPRYVTESDYKTKTCKWDGNEPLDFPSLEEARWIAMGLGLNGTGAVPVSLQYEIGSQPYRYAEGCFKWEWN